MTVAAAGLLELEQQELFEDEPQHSRPRHLACLVDRLTSRLGRQAVLCPKLLADAQPEHACQYLPAQVEPLGNTGGKGVQRKRPARPGAAVSAAGVRDAAIGDAGIGSAALLPPASAP